MADPAMPSTLAKLEGRNFSSQRRTLQAPGLVDTSRACAAGAVPLRIPIFDLARPKQVVKTLVRHNPALTLSAGHELFARQFGYRDWHDLTINHAAQDSSLLSALPGQEATALVGRVAAAFGVADGDALHALGKSRLLGAAFSSLDNQLETRAALWRAHTFGPSARDRPGSVVRDAARGKQPAYLIHGGRPSRILLDASFGDRADFEVITPRTPLKDFVPSRLWLPYGFWRLGDGSEVLFSRDYLPLWRLDAGRVERLDPWLWIEGRVEEAHFSTLAGAHGWASGPARDLALARLTAWRISSLPRLVEVMPHLFEPERDSFHRAVQGLFMAVGEPDRFPPFARLSNRLSWD